MYKRELVDEYYGPNYVIPKEMEAAVYQYENSVCSSFGVQVAQHPKKVNFVFTSCYTSRECFDEYLIQIENLGRNILETNYHKMVLAENMYHFYPNDYKIKFRDLCFAISDCTQEEIDSIIKMRDDVNMGFFTYQGEHLDMLEEYNIEYEYKFERQKQTILSDELPDELKHFQS